MKPLALVAATALLAPAAVAHADRREASVHVHAVGGPLSMEDDASTAGAGTGALAGLAVRASYATRNAWQYDTQLTLGYGRASFDAGQFLLGGGTPMTVPFTVSSQLARLDAGVTLRLGVRWIPTVRLAVGAQAVRRGSPVATAGGFEVTDRHRRPRLPHEPPPDRRRRPRRDRRRPWRRRQLARGDNHRARRAILVSALVSVRGQSGSNTVSGQDHAPRGLAGDRRRATSPAS